MAECEARPRAVGTLMMHSDSRFHAVCVVAHPVSFSLTLVDTLDSLAILGNLTEFYRASELVMSTVSFDTDITVSTFETNIRVLGGLLGAHSMMVDLQASGKV